MGNMMLPQIEEENLLHKKFTMFVLFGSYDKTSKY